MKSHKRSDTSTTVEFEIRYTPLMVFPWHLYLNGEEVGWAETRWGAKHQARRYVRRMRRSPERSTYSVNADWNRP